MKDSDIIKALECCIKSTSRSDCEELECPACEKQGCYFNNISEEDYPESLIEGISISLLDLINRQKAEIERYKGVIKILEKDVADAKAEAIKEFIAEFERRCIDGGIYPAFVKRQLEHVKAEMVGE